MAKTFLQLTNKVLKRFGEIPLTASNFGSQQGLPELAKDAVNDAIRQINQQEFEWPFNHQEGSQLFDGTNGVQLYAFPSDYKIADKDTFYIQRNDSLDFAGRRLRVLEYDEWVRLYRSNDEEIIADITDVSSTPNYVFLTPDNRFGVSPPPSQDLTILYNYWNSATELVAHDDVTNIPDRFDYVIADGASVFLHDLRDNVEGTRTSRGLFKEGIKHMRKQVINLYDHATDTRTSDAVRNG